MHDKIARRAIAAARWPARAIPTDAFTGNAAIIGGPVLLRGWSLCNKNAASQDFELYDGVDTNGTPLGFLHLATAAMSVIGFPSCGILCEQGIYLTIPGAPLRGAFYVTELDGPYADACEHHDQAAAKAGTYGPRG